MNRLRFAPALAVVAVLSMSMPMPADADSEEYQQLQETPADYRGTLASPRSTADSMDWSAPLQVNGATRSLIPTKGNPTCSVRVDHSVDGGTVAVHCGLWVRAGSTWTLIDAAQVTTATCSSMAGTRASGRYLNQNTVAFDTGVATHVELRIDDPSGSGSVALLPTMGCFEPRGAGADKGVDDKITRPKVRQIVLDVLEERGVTSGGVYAEADTLQSVVARGGTSTNGLRVAGQMIQGGGGGTSPAYGFTDVAGVGLDYDTSLITLRATTSTPFAFLHDNVITWLATGTVITPNVNNAVALGQTTERWSAVYGVAGDFSGGLNTRATSNGVSFGNTNSDDYGAILCTTASSNPTFSFKRSSGSEFASLNVLNLVGKSSNGSNQDFALRNASSTLSGLTLSEDAAVHWSSSATDSDGTQCGTLANAQTSLTDNVATTVVTIDLDAGERCGGTISYTIEALDATDCQTISGVIVYTAANKGDVYTSQITEVSTVYQETAAMTDMTDVWTISSGSGLINIQVQADTSLTTTTFRVNTRVSETTGQQVTFP